MDIGRKQAKCILLICSVSTFCDLFNISSLCWSEKYSRCCKFIRIHVDGLMTGFSVFLLKFLHHYTISYPMKWCQLFTVVDQWKADFLFFPHRCVYLFLPLFISQLFPCGISSKLNHLSLFALEDKSPLSGHSHTRNTHIVVTRVFSNASQMFNLSLHQINSLRAGDKDSKWKEYETKRWRERQWQ